VRQDALDDGLIERQGEFHSASLSSVVAAHKS